MFERFTDRARRVVVLAQEESRVLGHNYIGTEHVFLGMLAEAEGVAAKVLELFEVRLDWARSEVQRVIGQGGISPSGHIPFTPRCKKVMELSLREALQLGHNYIGTEHLLLALIREGEGVACQVLVASGRELSAVRATVMSTLAGYETKAVKPAAGLTDDEHRIVDLLAECFNLYAQKVCGQGRTRDADINEFAMHVHSLQHNVMAQAAARAHPDRYRLAGGIAGAS